MPRKCHSLSWKSTNFSSLVKGWWAGCTAVYPGTLSFTHLWLYSMDIVKQQINASCTLAKNIADGYGAIRTARGKLKLSEAMFSSNSHLTSPWVSRSKRKDLPRHTFNACQQKGRISTLTSFSSSREKLRATLTSNVPPHFWCLMLSGMNCFACSNGPVFSPPSSPPAKPSLRIHKYF